MTRNVFNHQDKMIQTFIIYDDLRSKDEHKTKLQCFFKSSAFNLVY